LCPFEPSNFLELAKKLMNHKDFTEISRWRTSIGRAYYAAFLFAYSKLLRSGFQLQEEQKIHKEVIEELKKEGFRRTSNKLERLRQLRITADYYLNDQIDIRQCQSSIQLSTNIINELNDFL